MAPGSGIKVFCQISQGIVIVMISTWASQCNMLNLYVMVTVENYCDYKQDIVPIFC